MLYKPETIKLIDNRQAHTSEIRNKELLKRRINDELDLLYKIYKAREFFPNQIRHVFTNDENIDEVTSINSNDTNGESINSEDESGDNSDDGSEIETPFEIQSNVSDALGPQIAQIEASDLIPETVDYDDGYYTDTLYTPRKVKSKIKKGAVIPLPAVVLTPRTRP